MASSDSSFSQHHPPPPPSTPPPSHQLPNTSFPSTHPNYAESPPSSPSLFSTSTPTSSAPPSPTRTHTGTLSSTTTNSSFVAQNHRPRTTISSLSPTALVDTLHAAPHPLDVQSTPVDPFSNSASHTSTSLRQRKTAPKHSSSPQHPSDVTPIPNPCGLSSASHKHTDLVDHSTPSLQQASNTDDLSTNSKMWGSSSAARGSYLPVNGRQVGPPTTSYLISWVAKHKVFVAFIIVATIVSLQVLLIGPVIMDLEPVKKLKQDGWSWDAPSWFGPRPESPSSWFPSHASPHSPVDTDFSGPAKSSSAFDLGRQAFPPPLSQIGWTANQAPHKDLYRDANPHRGELPTALQAILEREPVLYPPPWPQKAPEITPEMWPVSVWNDSSTTTAADAEHAELQAQEPDFRQPPWNFWKPPLDELSDSKKASTLPKVQYAFENPSKHSGRHNDKARDELVAYRQKMVKNAFLHAWQGYKKYAWGHDELRPVSKAAQDPFNGWGASIVDSLDTLLVMGLPKEYDLARQHVRDIDFRLVGGDRSAYGSADGRIPVFETAIRYLGGFISAYDLSGDALMRDRAEELAQLIMPAFDTPTGVPVGRIRMAQQPNSNSADRLQSGGSVILAEAGSLLLEFTRLWQTTGNRTYFDRVQRTTDWLDRNMTQAGRMESLFPTTLFPERNQAYGTYSFGGMADSYYEYLVKEFQLLGGRLSQYSRMYSDAIQGAKKLLITEIKSVPGTNLLTVGEINSNRYTPKLEHLACFTGGMLGLGSRIIQDRESDLLLAEGIASSCWWAYNSTLTGIGPENLVFYGNDDADRFELISLPDGTSRRGEARGSPIVGVRSVATSYLNRPETIESVFYMWRITGDPEWQERGWQMFASWVTHCMTDAGFSAIFDVNSFPASWSDSMESFTFAETFKYYYLLFSPPELISLDEYVFTTEAHPLLTPKNGKWGVSGQGSKKFWNPEEPEEAHLPSPTSGTYSGGERKNVGGLTNNQKHMVYAEWQRNQKAHAIRSLLSGLGTDSIKSKFQSLVSRMDWESMTLSPRAQQTSRSRSAAPATPEVGEDPNTEGKEEAEREEESEQGGGELEGIDPMSVIAGTKIYEMEDGSLAVELDRDGDLVLQQAILEELGFSSEAQPDKASYVLHREPPTDATKDEEASERKNQEEDMHMRRLRSKGLIA